MKNRSKDENFGSKPKEPTRKGPKVTFSKGDKDDSISKRKDVPYNPKKQDGGWYSKNTQITKDVTNLPFPWKNGLMYQVDYTPNAPAGNLHFQVPSVLCLDMAITLGGAKSANSLNTIANNLYSWVRYANSGSRNYEAPDLFMYLGAVVTPFAIASHISKCIGLTNVASALNRAYPRQVFEAMGLDFDDAISNIANYRGRLNRLIVRLNAYNVPRSLALFESAVWGFSGVYIESENPKDQLYVMRPSYGMEFDATHSEGSALKIIDFYNLTQPTLLSSWLDELEREIRILETDEDIGIISGDLLKVAGDAGIYQLAQVPEDFMLYPTFSEDILYKIKNVRCLPVCITNGTVSVGTIIGKADATANPWVSSGGYLYYQQAPGLGLAKQVVQSIGFDLGTTTNTHVDKTIAGTVNLIDTKNVTPTMDEINEDVAFKFSFDGTPDTTSLTNHSVFEIVNCGMFVCTRMHVFDLITNNVVLRSNDFVYLLGAYTDTFLQEAPALLGYFLHMRAFKYTILNAHYIFNTPGGYQYQGEYSGDFTNVHLLTPSEETAIFDQQLLSMFSVPARDHLGKALAYKG